MNFSISSLKILTARASNLIFVPLGKEKQAESQTEVPKEELPQKNYAQRFKTEYLKYAKVAVLFNIEPERALFTSAREDIKDIIDYIKKAPDRKDIPHILESSAENGIAGLLFAIGAPGYHFFMPIFTPLLLASAVIPAAIKASSKETREINPSEMEAAIEAVETREGLEKWEAEGRKIKQKKSEAA